MISTGRDTYMTIWSISEKDGRVSGRVSTSRKNKNSGEYVNSNWNVRFVGEASEKAKGLAEKSRIIVKSGDLSIENIFRPEQGEKPATSYVSVTIFNFETQDNTKTNTDDLPF